MKKIKTSAGLLMYRIRDGKPEVLLVHPGGPFWKNKDAGVWSIPKGEVNNSEAGDQLLDVPELIELSLLIQNTLESDKERFS